MPDPSRHGDALGLLLEVTVLLNHDMTTSLARDGLTIPRAHLLWELRRRGPSTQRVLAEALDVSPRNITGLVDGLVATGFVTREPHPTDRRATLVSFTTRGAQLAEQMDTGRAQLAESLFGDMPEGQLDGLVSGLGAVLTRLRQELEEPKGGNR